MGRVGAKRSKQAEQGGSSPSSMTSASKKRKTEKKKIAPQAVESAEKKMDPFLKSFCEKFKHPADAIQYLLQNSGISVDDFFKNHWETKPIAMHAAEPSTDLRKIFNLEMLKDLVAKSEAENSREKFLPEQDYIFSKLVDGKRDEEEVEIVTEDDLKNLYKEKYAIQVNQPQRFQDALWALMEKLECHFGSLVASHVYFIPAEVQLITPRYDDTEKFILQLDGSSSWKLSKFKGKQIAEFNDELKEEEIGEEILTAVLKAGDVLYIPKGVVFESKGVTDGVHINFSTYQGLDQMNLLTQTVGTFIEQQSELQPDFRKGLPIGYLPRANAISNADYADMLLKLAASLRSREEPLPKPEGLIQNFMSYRLPPYGCPEFDIEATVPISLESKISFRNKDHITWFTRKFSDSEMNEDQLDEEELAESELGPKTELVVFSSMNNKRSRHMMIESQLLGVENDAFSVGVEYERLLEDIYRADKPVALKSLNSKTAENEFLDVVVLARGLYSVGAINVE